MGRGVESKSAWVFFILSRYYGILNVELNVIDRVVPSSFQCLSSLKLMIFICFPPKTRRKFLTSKHTLVALLIFHCTALLQHVKASTQLPYHIAFGFYLWWTFSEYVVVVLPTPNHLLSMRYLQVLLLDEVTVDLDVVARMDLLDFFKEECEQVFTCFI